jgi:uncharacterized membrane protein YhhN
MPKMPESNTQNNALLLLIGTLAAFAYMVGMALDLTTVKLLVKGIPALAIAAWVWPRGERRVALGLVFGAIGDICLNIPGAFLAGMIAFAIGHGLYVWAFTRWSRANAWHLLLPVLLYLALPLPLMLQGTGELTVPVTLYLGIIGAMIWRAAVVADDAQQTGLARWAALLGALLFAFSDTLIGVNKFVMPLPGAGFPIIVTYWLGQLLIGTSAVTRR